jgi:hypothetical protein
LGGVVLKVAWCRLLVIPKIDRCLRRRNLKLRLQILAVNPAGPIRPPFYEFVSLGNGPANIDFGHGMNSTLDESRNYPYIKNTGMENILTLNGVPKGKLP